ncbi:hypothetical protein OE88DRAFT_1730881 [Heliocybe sulcata]|uniref:Uncharacterized protein n=1 Tax=Heliocybe sulcata TaxID=5364 RepID=A0A5C3NKX8_9AGAM|nr:hypothetical protein OE88DRAFT_1730881 [Heliocybe sulcata]
MQLLRRKEPRTNKIAVQLSSILPQQVIPDYLLNGTKSYAHWDGPQDVRGPGRKQYANLSDLPLRRKGPRIHNLRQVYASLNSLWTAFLTTSSANRILKTPTLPRAILTDDFHSLPLSTSFRTTPTLLQALLSSAFHTPPSLTSVRKTPTLPRATLTNDRCVPQLHSQDAYAPPGYPYGRSPPAPSPTSIREMPTLPRATLTDSLLLLFFTSDYAVHDAPTLPRATVWTILDTASYFISRVYDYGRQLVFLLGCM